MASGGRSTGWADQVAATLQADDPVVGALQLSGEAVQLEAFSVELVFAVAPPAGVLASQLIRIDRAFRLAARFTESGLSPEEFWSRRRQGVPVLDGFVVEGLVTGSLRVPLRTSKRLAKSAASGVVVVGTAIAYLNGAFDLADHLNPRANDPAQVVVIREKPAPHELTIKLHRGNEIVEVRLRGDGQGGYQLEEARPIRELEP